MALAEYGEWLHRRALETGVIFMDGIGFAPGSTASGCTGAPWRPA